MIAIFLAVALVLQSNFGAAQSSALTLGVTSLLRDSLHLISGKRVGLITNHTGKDESGRSSIDLLHEAPGVRLAALFAPEHGIRGSAEGGSIIASSVDRATGIPIHSLYGATKTPTAAMLAGVDVLIYDIQDIGARMYTYVWTMTLAAEAAKKAGKMFVVLDRPNPIRADIIEGGLIEKRYRSFTGLHNVPVRYGLTPGELVLYLARTKQIDANPIVVPMKNYRHSMWWRDSGLEWIRPSPNIRDEVSALFYPGISFFEGTNISEGRGTDEPFRLVGARWLTDAPAVAQAMNSRRLGGVRFEAVRRQIARGQKYGGETIPMVRLIVTDADAVRSTEIAAHLLREITRRHPREVKWQPRGIEELSGSRDLRSMVLRGGVENVIAKWRAEAAQFSRDAGPYRLY